MNPRATPTIAAFNRSRDGARGSHAAAQTPGLAFDSKRAFFLTAAP